MENYDGDTLEECVLDGKELDWREFLVKKTCIK